MKVFGPEGQDISSGDFEALKWQGQDTPKNPLNYMFPIQVSL